jgi:hypothetical protein
VVPASSPRSITPSSRSNPVPASSSNPKVVGGNVPKEYIPAVEKGFKTSIDKGPLAGYPCLDFKVTLKDGGFHAVDSSSIAFEIAAKAAYRQTMPKCAPQILEPIMKLDVFTPEEKVGDVIGDLNRRRGMIKARMPTHGGVRVKADAPLSAMFGYIGDLRTMTSGRGQFSMEFSHYAPARRTSPTRVIAKAKEREEARNPSSSACSTAITCCTTATCTRTSTSFSHSPISASEPSCRAPKHASPKPPVPPCPTSNRCNRTPPVMPKWRHPHRRERHQRLRDSGFM